MPLLRHALATAGTLIVVLGIGVTGSAAAARAASGTGTQATVKVSHLVDSGRTHLHASRGGGLAASLGIEGPWGIAAGPDGALWFTNRGSIGRITTSGTVTINTDPSIDNSNGITTGPDGALWFTSSGNNEIGRIDPATGTVTSYTDPSMGYPFGITAGPDGALWFTDNGGNTIGRIDPATGTVTTYTDPSIAYPVGITAGPDGAVWFTNSSGGRPSIGRITTSGTVTSYPASGGPFGITAGPDGALWFTTTVKIGRITISGAVTSYPGAEASFSQGITSGPDGALWFTDQNGSIGRIDPSTGTFTSYADPGPGPGTPEPEMITAGPDGALWFTNTADNTIGRITTSGTVTIYSYSPTATTLTAAPNPSSYGQPVTFTATVSPSDGGGTVTFSADGNPVTGCSSQPLTLTSGTTYQATCTTSSLAPGGHAISAAYSGDPAYTPSAANLTQEIGPTSTSVTSSLNPSAYGQPVTFTATVSPSDGGGTVTFSADGNPVTGCSSQPLTLTSGTTYQATCTTSSLAPGHRTIEAAYSGDTNYSSSSATTTETVNQQRTATILKSGTDPSTYAHAVTFTATVSPTNGQGSVSFARGTGAHKITLCPRQDLSLVNGSYRAACTVSSLPAATYPYTIVASYTGDTDYIGSSGAVRQTVNKTPTSTAVSSSMNPSGYGHRVTFTAAVRSADGSGTVTFWYAGNTIAGCTSRTLQDIAGIYKATCTTSALPGGTDKVSAVYSGDDNCFGSTGRVNQVVDRIPTKTALISSPKPSTSGEIVTITATITPTNGGGTVAFSSNGHAISDCTSKTLTRVGTSYQAVCKTATLAPGSDTLRAAYSGDAGYSRSSGTQTQVVKAK